MVLDTPASRLERAYINARNTGLPVVISGFRHHDQTSLPEEAYIGLQRQRYPATGFVLDFELSHRRNREFDDLYNNAEARIR